MVRDYVWTIFLYGLILNACPGQSANILNLMGCPSPSHHIWDSTLVNGLAAKGHNVTVLSTNIDPNAPPNVHYILLEGVYDYMYQDLKVDLISLADETPLESVYTVYAFAEAACAGIVHRSSRGLQTLLDYPDDFHFDLVLYDYTLGPCILGFLHKFKYPPLVGFTAYNNPSYTVDVIGGHNYFSYIPFCTSKYDSEMNLWQRAYNLYMYAVDSYYREYELLPFVDDASEKIFGPDYPRARDLEAYMQLVLISTHPAIDFPEPLPPNVIPVGGLQIKDPKPLPEDVDSFLSAGKKGSVLFSMGTNIHSKNLGLDKQKAILEVFSQLPEYNFLWKFEDKDFPLPLPSNVLIKPWTSQNDVLNHSNVRLFVSHGGALSTYEATWHGVPVLGIPFIVDQHRNVFKSMKAGVAEHIYFPEITSRELKEKLIKMLTNPKYAENMKKRSQRLRDQPEKPLDRAVWWIEYLLRNPDPSHLQSPVLKLGFIRANSLDLYGLLILIVLAVAGVVLYVGWKLHQILLAPPSSGIKIKIN